MGVPNWLRLAGAAVLFSASGPIGGVVCAQAPPPSTPPGEVSVLKLFFADEELLTTATRKPEPSRTAPAVAQVFTRDQLERMGVRTLSELLARVASVYVSTQTNSRESAWFRGVRNRYNDKILLLVDGIPLRDPVYEHAPTDDYLPLENIERVEVLRGPGSALYGTNAYAGVVQLFTRKAPPTPGGSAFVGGGDESTWEAGVQGGGRWGGNGLFAWGSAFDTNGDGLTRNIRYEKQALGQNPKRRLAGGIVFTRGGLTLDAKMLHYYHTFFADRDVPTWRWKDEGYWYDDLFLSGQYEKRFSEHLSFQGIAYAQDYDWNNFWRQFAPGRERADATPDDVVYEISVAKRSRRYGADIQFNWQPTTRHDLVFGLTWERESIQKVEDRYHTVTTGVEFIPYFIPPHALTTAAAYAQETWRPREWATLTAGLRADHHGEFGWHLSPRLAATLHPGPKAVFRLLYGEAFRAPSARELYTVDLLNSFPPGNPYLKPEQIRTFEATFSYTFSEYASLQMVGFYEETRDAIFSENNRPYANYPGMHTRGGEAALELAWPNRVTARLSGSYTGSEAYNVPEVMAQGEVNVPFAARWNWNLSARFVGERPRDPADLFRYDLSRPPYHRADIPSYWSLDSTLLAKGLAGRYDFSLTLRNLLDQEGSEPTFEPTKYHDLERPGRAVLFRVGVRF